MNDLTTEARELYTSLVSIPWQVGVFVALIVAALYGLAKWTEIPDDEPVDATPLRDDCGDQHEDTYCRRPAGHPRDVHRDGYGTRWPVVDEMDGAA